MRSLCPGRQAGSVCRPSDSSHYPRPLPGVPGSSGLHRSQDPGFAQLAPLSARQKGQLGSHLPAATHYGPIAKALPSRGGGRGSEQGCPHPGGGPRGPGALRTVRGEGRGHSQAHSAASVNMLEPRAHAPPHPRVLSGSTTHIQLFLSWMEGVVALVHSLNSQREKTRESEPDR